MRIIRAADSLTLKMKVKTLHLETLLRYLYLNVTVLHQTGL